MKTFSDEWTILKFFKHWTSTDIRNAIDADVDLAELILDNWLKTAFIRSIAKRRGGGDLKNYLSAGHVLYWFSCRLPDLYAEIVKDEAGVSWIQRNFIKVRQILNI